MYSRFGSPPPREGTFWSNPLFRDSEKFLSVELFLQAASKRLKRDCDSTVKLSKERPKMAAARCEQYENGCPFRLRAMRSESGTSWSVSTESCEWKHVHPGKTPSPTPPDAYSESEPYKTIARRTVVLYDKPTFFSDASRFFLDIRDRSNSAYGYPCVPFRQLATSLTAYCAGRYGSEHCDYKIRAIRAGSGWKAVPRECNWTHSHDAKQIEAKLSPPVDERLPARLPMPAVPRSDFMKVSEIPFPDSLRPRTKFPKMPQAGDVFRSPGSGLIAATANIVFEYGVSTESLWWNPVKGILACNHGRDTAAECGYRMRLGHTDEGSRVVLSSSNLSHNHGPAQVKRRVQAWLLAQDPPYIFDVVALRLPPLFGKLRRASPAASASDSRDAKRRRLSSPSRAASPLATSDRDPPRTPTLAVDAASKRAAGPIVKQEPIQDMVDAGLRSPEPRAFTSNEALVLAARVPTTSLKKEDCPVEAQAEPDRADTAGAIATDPVDSPNPVTSAVEPNSTAPKPETVERASAHALSTLDGTGVPTATETAGATARVSEATVAGDATAPCGSSPASATRVSAGKTEPTVQVFPKTVGTFTADKACGSALPGAAESTTVLPGSPPPVALDLESLAAAALHTSTTSPEDPDEPDQRDIRPDAIEAFLVAVEPALAPFASVLVAAGINSHQALVDFASLAPAIRRTLLRRLDKTAAGPSRAAIFTGLARNFPS